MLLCGCGYLERFSDGGLVQAEAGSRVELYEAQISKMQLALERADQENSRLEQELRALAESSAKGRDERRGSSLAMLRDRVRSISLLSSPLEQQAAERLLVLPLSDSPRAIPEEQPLSSIVVMLVRVVPHHPQRLAH